MLEEKDVQADPSPAEEKGDAVFEDVNKPQEPSPEATPAIVEEEVIPSTQEVKDEVKDDRPIENVAWETKRKLDELVPNLQREIADLKSVIQEGQQKSTKPEYTKAQLQAYAMEPNTATDQRLWAFGEVDKMEKAERASEYANLMKNTKDQSVSESRKTQSAKWVADNFPETVIMDHNGNMAGWDTRSPLLQRAQEYIGRSDALRNDPEGFSAAVKMAAFDMGMGSNQALSKKLNRNVGQLRKEQKKQLASTGGTRPQVNPAAASKVRLSKLQEEYAKTGSREVFAAIVKHKQMNPYI